VSGILGVIALRTDAHDSLERGTYPWLGLSEAVVNDIQMLLSCPWLGGAPIQRYRYLETSGGSTAQRLAASAMGTEPKSRPKLQRGLVRLRDAPGDGISRPFKSAAIDTASCSTSRVLYGCSRELLR
jgi:hypothetical protein